MVKQPETKQQHEDITPRLKGPGEEVVYPTRGELEPGMREGLPGRNSAIEECSYWSHSWCCLSAGAFHWNSHWNANDMA